MPDDRRNPVTPGEADPGDPRPPWQQSADDEALLDELGIGLCYLAPDGIVLWANRAQLDLLGYTRGEFLGRPIAAFHLERREAQDLLSRMAEGRNLRNVPARLRAKDGAVREVLISSRPVLVGGELVRTRCITRDVTEQKGVSDARSLLAAIVDSSDDAIVGKSLEGTILSWNAAAERLFGYSAAEAVGQHITLIIPPQLHDEERTILERLWRGEKIEHFETVRVAKDGRRIDLSLTISPVRDQTGHILGASKIARDISGQKQSEAALREQTRTAETLNRVGNALAAELDVDRIVQFVTEQATAVTGAEIGAFFYNAGIGENTPFRLHTVCGASALSLDGFANPLDSAILEPTYRGERVVRLQDLTHKVPHGQIPPFHHALLSRQPVRSYLAVPVVSRSGEPLGGLFFGHGRAGVFTEHHERIVSGIAAQAAIAIDNGNLYGRLQESEQRFRQLAEHVTDVFWIVDIRGSRPPHMLYVSPAYEDIWGRSCATVYRDSRSFLEAVHPDDLDRVLDALARQQRGEATAEEYRVVHDDGSLRWVWDRAFPIGDDAGKVIRIAGITEDITERKVAEDRVRESEERYRRLSELLPVAVYACEAPSGVLTYYNGQAVELWGRVPTLRDSADRFCGSQRMFSADGSLLRHEDSPMAVALAQGRSFRNQDLIIERADDTRVRVLLNIEPIRDAEGRVTGAINACLDVSAIKDAERRLRDADRRKDEFLATLSHELRNPLAPMRYALETIERVPDDSALLQQCRQVLERQVRHMVRLIDDLLDVSRISHDKLELKRESTDLARIVAIAIETNRPPIDQAGQELVVELPDQPVALHVDTLRIAQVVGNLLGNASRYTPAGGRIRLTARPLAEAVVLSVEDNGQGIPVDQLDSIFEMFSQADRSARMQGGLGVGLTLVKRLVEMHGGTVRAESRGPGAGSRFEVTLPTFVAASHPQGEAPGATPSLPPPTALKRILVVDDNRDSADSLSMLLSMAGHDARSAYDGPQALEEAERFRPHLMLLDLGLPDMDGYEVCRRIRLQPWGQAVRVAAVTGWGQDQDRAASRKAGFDDHLVKPVGYDALGTLLALP